ncbi:MAG TPA: GNAT family N-acetyltransferase [Acidimicrobiales bacterium]|nr:GNAT family N-acetyltransferase [Acidimicrobiales bacterium]
MEGVRQAQRDDSERCAAICMRAVNELDQMRGGTMFARRETGLVAKALSRPGGLDRLLSDPRRVVLVGTLDDVVIALAVGRVDDVGEVSVGVVDALYVEPEARGVGVGRELIETLTSSFLAHGCVGVDAAALPGDRSSKNFFEAAGFKARLITMYRPIG